MNPHFWWYVSRSSGMVAAVLLVMTIVWGLLASTKVLRRPGLPAWIADLHRGLGALTVVFVVVHLTALVGDNTVHFAWTELFVPFASTWRRGPVARGDRSVLGTRDRPGIIAAGATQTHRFSQVLRIPSRGITRAGAGRTRQRDATFRARLIDAAEQPMGPT